MKRKLLTLLTLLLCAVGGAWGDTYTNEAATVTWAFTSHTNLTSTNVPSDAFLTTNFTSGSNLQEPTTFNTNNCTAGWSAQTLVYFKPKVAVAKNAADAAENMLEWTITPATGITFTPENVSVTACTAGGTGDPQLTIYAVYSDNSTETIQSQTNPRRPDKTDQGDGPSVYTKALTSAKNGTFKVRIYLAGLTNTSKGMAFTNIVVTGKVSGTPVATTTYTITAATNNASLGTVTGSATVAENAEVTLTATPTDAGSFTKWQKDGVDFFGNTVNPITVTATADATYTAIFEAKKALTFAKGEGTGTIPATDYVLSGENYTIPECYFLYKSGATLTGWNDGTSTYAPGATISNITTDVALTAVFTDNTVSLGDAATTVNWTFDRSHGAPSIACEGNEIDYVQHTTISGTRYDAVMHVNTVQGAAITDVRGKLNNTSRTSDAQVNKGTIFTIPVIKGAVITFNGTHGTATAGDITFGGNNGSVSGAVTTYTYNGDTGTLDIVDTKGDFYPSGISVSYPLVEQKSASDLTITSGAAINKDLDDTTADKTHQITYITSGTGAVTFSSSNSKVASVSASGLVTALSNGTATITVSQEADASHAAGEATMTITVTGGITILGTDEIELVYTNNGYNSNTLTWTNGTYSLVAATVGISGNDGQCFKLQNRTYTLKVPSNIRVDRIEYTGYDYNGNYSDNEGATSTSTITVDGTTAMTGWKAYYANYNSAVNTTIAEDIEHTTGSDITLVVTNTGQLIGTMKLYVSEIQPTEPPTLSSTSHTTTHNGSVTLNFSVDMQEATGTIDGQSITAEGGSSALVFHYWGLDYSKEVTFTVPASSLRDKYGNAYAGEDITITFNTEAKPVLTKKKFDVIVGTEGNEDLQEVLNRYKNYSNSERAYIFIPDGTYKLTGNSSITTSKAQTGYVYNESTNQTGSATNYPAGTYTDNAMTQLKASNLSIIGQSTEGTILYNIPYIPGISYTSTLEFKSGSNDNYIQDFTLKNMYAGGANDKGVAVAFYDRGTRTIAKNISCWSNQDTYVSNGARDYYETCTFAGTVDFICGNGDVWFQECNLIINDRSGNVITAPRTAATEKWGYVFYRNTISLAQGATAAQNGNWYLGRPWNNSPAATYLYTKMNTTPKAAGWTNMTNNCTLRFHEYGSTDGNGSALSLSNRSISACNGNSDSDNPVLTADQAAKYTLHNVVGGDDGWDPTEFTAQVSVTGLAVSGNTLSWDNNDDALCWMVFKDGVYYDNVITNSITLSGAGIYSVRAANARGGLGEASEIATVSTLAGRNYGTCVTGCGLDFTNVTDAKAYIATGLNSAKTAVVLQQVNKVATNTPLIIYTEEKTNAATVRVPITTDDPDATVESNLLVAGDGTTAWDGTAGYTYYYIASDQFHKAISGTLQSGKAYLKIDNVNSTARLGFVFADEATSVSNVNRETITNNRYYDLQGRRIDGSRLNPGVYIKDGRKVVVK